MAPHAYSMLIQTLEGYSCLMIGEREFGTIFRTSHATDTEVILITYNGNQKQSQTLYRSDLGLDSGDTFRAHGTLSDWNLPSSSGSKDWPWLREILTGFRSVRSIIIMPGLECLSVLIDILLFLCRSYSALVPKDRPSVIEVPLIHPYSHVAYCTLSLATMLQNSKKDPTTEPICRGRVVCSLTGLTT